MDEVLARKNAVIKGTIKHKPETTSGSYRLRGYVPIATPTYLTVFTTESTQTVSLSSVVATNAIAVVVKVRVQDTSASSYAEVRPKASVQTGQKSKFRVYCSPADNLIEQQGVIPINSTRQILLQRVDAVGSGGLQTCSLAVVGFFL